MGINCVALFLLQVEQFSSWFAVGSLLYTGSSSFESFYISLRVSYKSRWWLAVFGVYDLPRKLMSFVLWAFHLVLRKL